MAMSSARMPNDARPNDGERGCQRVLKEAQKRGVRWHLAIDF